MSTELSTLNFTPDQLKLITDTVAKGATSDELKLFLYRCQNLGLDPLKPGQIHFIKYGNSPGSIVIGIDGFRSRAARTGKLSGIKRGATRDDKGKLIGGWSEVYRTDWKEPAREEAPLSEYNTGKSTWADKPETMIKKVAEAAALRMAFPDELGGLYEKSEMDRAEESSQRITPATDQLANGDGFDDGTYRIPFGKFKHKTLQEVGSEDLRGYVEWQEKEASKSNKPMRPEVKEFIERTEKFIGFQENFNPDDFEQFGDKPNH